MRLDLLARMLLVQLHMLVRHVFVREAMLTSHVGNVGRLTS